METLLNIFTVVQYRIMKLCVGLIKLSSFLMSFVIVQSKGHLFTSTPIEREDFEIEIIIPDIKTDMLCQIQADIRAKSAYKLDIDSGECHLGQVKATLPLIAREKSDSNLCWIKDNDILPKKVLHVMTFDLKRHEVVDFSFQAEVSRPMGGLESWMLGLPQNDTLTAFWHYRGGALFCGILKCYFKSPSLKPAVPAPGLTKERTSYGGDTYLTGRPWLIRGTESEILEPWGEWVPGPAMAKSTLLPCVQDLEDGDGTVLVAGFGSAYLNWYYTYNPNNSTWITKAYPDFGIDNAIRYTAPSCAKIRNPNTQHKIIVLAGGTTNNYAGLDLVLYYNIDLDTWEKGPSLPMGRRFGIFVGSDQGLDGFYLIGGKSSWGNNTSLRLKDDMSGWDLFPQWDIGSNEQSRPVPIVYH